jgi:putative redox protein
MTLRLYAERKGWPLERTRVAVRHDKLAGQTPPDVFVRQIVLDGPLDAGQTARLMQIADNCPVHRTLEGGARVVNAPLAAPAPSPAVAEAAADAHFRDMEDQCRKADAPVA